MTLPSLTRKAKVPRPIYQFLHYQGPTPLFIGNKMKIITSNWILKVARSIPASTTAFGQSLVIFLE